MTREPHDFSVDLTIYRLCSRCAKPDLMAVRRVPCVPLRPELADGIIRRKVAMASQFRGTPTTPQRPLPNPRGQTRTPSKDRR